VADHSDSGTRSGDPYENAVPGDGDVLTTQRSKVTAIQTGAGSETDDGAQLSADHRTSLSHRNPTKDRFFEFGVAGADMLVALGREHGRSD
jgi:hypothetical protein